MDKKLIWLLVIVIVTTASLAQAQQLTKMARVGLLGTVSPSINTERLDAFRQGLRKLGYQEGKNILIEYRWAEGKPERLPQLAAELVQMKVDVIVTSGPTPTRAAKAATSTIPIVMAWDYDPVGNGFVASLANPGGNLTGLSTQAPEISGKQLELLKEIIPKLSRVAVFGSSSIPGNADALRATELAAKALAVQVQFIELGDSTDIGALFQAARKGRADAALAFSIRALFSQRQQVAQLAIKNLLPVIYGELEQVEAGGLVAYGVSIADLFHRAATYVDKILKGRTPADLPVEQPVKFEFVINLKAAKQIGLTIPPNVLVRADRVIR